MDNLTPRFFGELYGDELIAKENDVEQVCEDAQAQIRPPRGMFDRARNIFIAWLFTIVLSGYIGSIWARKQGNPLHTYSPLASELEYVSQVFEQDIVNAPPEFQDSNTVDEAWLALYDFGMATSLSNYEADRIPNATSGYTHGDTEHNVIQFDVFHQLHCLDLLRYALEPHYGLKNDSRLQLAKATLQGKEYRSNEGVQRELQQSQASAVLHINHCLNSLRQSLMCHSDVSMNVYRPDDRGIVKIGVAHSCRNFNRIRKWARNRQFVPD